ncbi:MAG: hypothetical protein GY948_11420 [Alphaproteobacteria bacterium]|nr:hypothetical protein [Alphaproteobacteria bacterium]
MQRAAEAPKLSSDAHSASSDEPKPLRAEPRESKKAAPIEASAPIAAKSKAPKSIRHPVRQNFDLIALWSVVAPSTITAVFAGVAMSGSNVPLPYAIMFICAWFAVTSGLAVAALKLFNTKQFIDLLHASAPRLGMAAIICALISVLAVEGARLSITAFAATPPQQVGVQQKPIVSRVRSTSIEKVSLPPAARSKQVASARSVHFPSTPDVISSEKKAPSLAGSIDETVVALPAPTPDTTAQETDTVTTAAVRPARRADDKLLGRISAKGKFLTHRSSSRWSGSGKRAKRLVAAPDRRNFLEKLFKPVINSASAKAPSRRVRSGSDDLSELSR